MLAGLTQLTSLGVSRRGRYILEDGELDYITKLSSLRHLSLAGALLATVHGQTMKYAEGWLDLLCNLVSCAFLDIRPSLIEIPIPHWDSESEPISLSKAWKALVKLQHLPLRELHIGVEAPQPPHPAGPEACAFHKDAQEALVGCPDRLGMALMRGTRGWPSPEEAHRMLCPRRQLHS